MIDWRKALITMGLRVAPKVVSFAIYDTETETILNIEDINIPVAFKWPDALKYIRSTIFDVLREYSVEKAGVRTTEPKAKKLSVERVHIEGVIQEAFASSSLVDYFAGPISVGAAFLGIERGKFKPMVKDGCNDMNVEGWEDLSEAQREAVLYAMGAISA